MALLASPTPSALRGVFAPPGDKSISHRSLIFACLAEGEDPVQASFDLVLAHAGVSSAIVGTINPAHLRHNVACAMRTLNRT